MGAGGCIFEKVGAERSRADGGDSTTLGAMGDPGEGTIPSMANAGMWAGGDGGRGTCSAGVNRSEIDTFIESS